MCPLLKSTVSLKRRWPLWTEAAVSLHMSGNTAGVLGVAEGKGCQAEQCRGTSGRRNVSWQADNGLPVLEFLGILCWLVGLGSSYHMDICQERVKGGGEICHEWVAF